MDKTKVDALTSELFKLLMSSEHSEAESMAAGIQALCMCAAFHSNDFADLQHKMSVAARFGSEYIAVNYQAFEQAKGN